MVYVSFFPQLVAGPIERASRLIPQIQKPRKFDYEKAKEGLGLVLIGLVKKIVIADAFAASVNAVFKNYSELTRIVKPAVLKIESTCCRGIIDYEG
mgnify:CR=1 FL=1